ncbi:MULTISPECIES: DUF2663 family protein [Bacillaceae]|uniref:YpbF family protein n=1 Tax=Evansella alkalicola TaxID=745819 RepID=A0ABS6K1Y8_9BACI|nr:DUF2663 family protein [Litchfieldia alkalitelluris]MBU9723989.1 YpbF family protein [Bacillus alkalicola]
MENKYQKNVKSYDTIVLDALIEAKMKEVKAEKDVTKWGYFFLSVLLAGVVYLVVKLSTGVAVGSYLTFLLSDIFLLIWLGLLFIGFHFFTMKSKYFEKKEKDFDELKEDIIDRASDIWNSPELERKKLLQYQELKEKYDINLYHK